MTRQEQYDKLQAASKMLHDARRMILEARAGGDATGRQTFFGRLQVAHSKAYESLELLAETCHDLRRNFPSDVK